MNIAARQAERALSLRIPKPIWYAVTVVVAAVLGLGALAGVASLTARPSLFLLAGLAIYVGAMAVGIVILTRDLPPAERRRRGGVQVGVAAVACLVVFGLPTLLPARDPHLPPAPVPAQQFWDLSTGSRIAYVRLPAVGPARPTPIIFVHGGPSVADMQGDAAYFGQLARDGFDVYVYDQVGTGRSSRLADPGQYTLARQVADLEAIRGQIGADRVVLIGHSWGGEIAAGYLAEHGEHVERAIFSSPGPLPGTGDTSDRGLLGRLSLRERLRVYRLILAPRMFLDYTLLQINPRAAHAFVGDREMDARFDRVYNRSRPALHCDGLASGPELHGLGFYAYQFPQSAASPPPADPRPALAGRTTPALVIKGSCDYLSWSSAVDYRDALLNAQIVYLSGAGHNAYQDRPQEFLETIRSFLDDQPLPIAPWAGGVPADFEGPA